MNMANENDRRDFRRQVFFSIAGISVGLAVAGLIALFINNVIEPTMQVETQDLVEYSGEVFSIWFRVDSVHKDVRATLVPQLEADLNELLRRLEVPIESIPLPIDVIVHDSPEMMQLTTLRRKSANALYSFYSVIDLLYNEDPYSRLAELVLAFGWGQCSSQLLYRGMLMTIASPDRDFHVPIAAAPERLLYSLDEILLLEQAGAFEETLYQRYQSPFSARLALGSLEALSEFRSMASDVEDEAADYDIADFQAASLVQYLIECGGLRQFRSAWGPGTTEALLARLACSQRTDLYEDWLAVVRETDETDAEFPYYQARFSFEAGDTETAAQLTDVWNPTDLAPAANLLGVRTQLAAGNFAAAARFADATGATMQEMLTSWILTYAGWQSLSEGAFTVLARGTQAALADVLDRVRTAYEQAVAALDYEPSELPSRVSVFYYETEDEKNLGATILPVRASHRTLWHISAEDDPFAEFVATLPSFVTKKETASNLLRNGLVAALAVPREELIVRGCELLRAGQWTALWRIGFGGMPEAQLQIETGLMVRLILDRYGVDVIRDLWVATARIGGGSSLDTAIKNVLDTSRTEIEKSLIESVLDCE